jgi:voltage-dependent potassium channel beta subunit
VVVQYGYLGRSGLKISKLSYGSWVTFGKQLDVDGAAEVMAAAFDHGCNFFDNAEVYGDGASEEVMGAALKQLGWGRDTYLVSTKIFWGGPGPNQRGLSRKHIVEGTLGALRRLQLDYVDLVFCHRPDPHTPIEETVRAMNHVIDRGWAFYWGTSEWSAEQLREAWRVARENHLIGPTMEQPQYHMFHRERVEVEYADLVRDFGLGTTIWSPLASGFLTGKYNDGIPEGSRLAMEGMDWLKGMVLGSDFGDKVAKVRRLTEMAGDLGGTMSQLALAWAASHPHVSTVITGSSRMSQLQENFGAVALLEKLTPSVLAEIDEVLGNRPAPPHDFRDS